MATMDEVQRHIDSLLPPEDPRDWKQEWKDAVNNDDTEYGFDDWVDYMMHMEDEVDDSPTCDYDAPDYKSEALEWGGLG